MAWAMHKTASGFNSLDNSELAAEILPEILNDLKKYFGKRLTMSEMFGADGNSAAFEINIDHIRITIGRDIWSGAFIMAWDSAGNDVIEEIKRFFEIST